METNFKDNEVLVRKELIVKDGDVEVTVTGAVWKKPFMTHLSNDLYSQIFFTKEVNERKSYYGPNRHYGFNTEADLDSEMNYIKEHITEFKYKEDELSSN